MPMQIKITGVLIYSSVHVKEMRKEDADARKQEKGGGGCRVQDTITARLAFGDCD